MSTWLAKRALANGGCLRFDHFMQLALYDPAEGYYTTRITAVGRTGDFSTSATRSDLLARSIAGWAQAEARTRRLDRPQLVELGGGDGSLARGILGRLPWWPRFGYHVVEISPKLRALQRKRLGGRRVLWHTDVRTALAETNGEALLFSNEFVDAFPCRRFVRAGGAWQELFLCYNDDDGTWHERWSKTENLPDSSVLNAWVPPERQVVEVHESYRRWLQTAAEALRRGSLLTIDYGGHPGEIYHRRPAGTVRAYSHHQRLTGRDLYRNPGRQDLTADVNFEDLERWGAASGLATVAYLTQDEFVRTWGPPRPKAAPGNFPLADAVSVGAAFKVLHQRK